MTSVAFYLQDYIKSNGGKGSPMTERYQHDKNERMEVFGSIGDRNRQAAVTCACFDIGVLGSMGEVYRWLLSKSTPWQSTGPC